MFTREWEVVSAALTPPSNTGGVGGLEDVRANTRARDIIALHVAIDTDLCIDRPLFVSYYVVVVVNKSCGNVHCFVVLDLRCIVLNYGTSQTSLFRVN